MVERIKSCILSVNHFHEPMAEIRIAIDLSSLVFIEGLKTVFLGLFTNKLFFISLRKKHGNLRNCNSNKGEL